MLCQGQKDVNVGYRIIQHKKISYKEFKRQKWMFAEQQRDEKMG